MGAKTLIEWCSYRNAEGVLVPGYTFNPWIGCAHADLDGGEDPACANCYAEVGTMARVQRHRGLPIWGQNADRHRTGEDYWRNPLRWNEAARKAGVRPRVFCASLADIFEGRRDLDPWRRDLFRLIETCDALDWLLLTKRPHLAAELAPAAWGGGWPEHVWFGFSAGTQRALDRRAPEAMKVPARTRFISLEPLLQRVDLSRWIGRWECCSGCGEAYPVAEAVVDGGGGALDKCAKCGDEGQMISCWGEGQRDRWESGERYASEEATEADDGPALHWIIVGGESGHGARPFDLAWAEAVSKQCRDASVSFFFKQAGALIQLGDWMPAARNYTKSPKGGDVEELSHLVPRLAAAGVFRREWPEVSRG